MNQGTIERDDILVYCIQLARSLELRFLKIDNHYDRDPYLPHTVHSLTQAQVLPIELLPSLTFIASIYQQLIQCQYVEPHLIQSVLYHMQIPPLNTFLPQLSNPTIQCSLNYIHQQPLYHPPHHGHSLYHPIPHPTYGPQYYSYPPHPYNPLMHHSQNKSIKLQMELLTNPSLPSTFPPLQVIIPQENEQEFPPLSHQPPRSPSLNVQNDSSFDMKYTGPQMNFGVISPLNRRMSTNYSFSKDFLVNIPREDDFDNEATLTFNMEPFLNSLTHEDDDIELTKGNEPYPEIAIDATSIHSSSQSQSDEEMEQNNSFRKISPRLTSKRRYLFDAPTPLEIQQQSLQIHRQDDTDDIKTTTSIWIQRMEEEGHIFDEKAIQKFHDLANIDPYRAVGITISFDLRKDSIQNKSAWLARACFNCQRKNSTPYSSKSNGYRKPMKAAIKISK